MTDRPIIFSAPMILALLAGRKFQTRRVLKPQPEPFDALFSKDGRWWTGDDETGEVYQVLRVPFARGDRLWVKEAWRGDVMDRNNPARTIYRADVDRDVSEAIPWRSSLHMSRARSRLTLTVTNVRVQRLQEISEDDARAEGVVPVRDPTGAVWFHGPSTQICGQSVQDGFRRLWNSLHGPDAWSANPWVAAVTFTVEHRNIDAGGSPC